MDSRQIALLRSILPPVAFPEVTPEPDWTPPGWYADHPILAQLIQQRRPSLILDVGSYMGASATAMARYAAAVNPDAVVVAIDTWLGSLEHYTIAPIPVPERQYGSMFGRFCSNVARAGVAGNIVCFPQTSVTAAHILKHHGVRPDFIYLDASHEYADVLVDLNLYWDLLADGGVLVGDDFEAPWQGVIRAVAEFVTLKGIELNVSVHPATCKIDGKIFLRKEQTKFVLFKPQVSSMV